MRHVTHRAQPQESGLIKAVVNSWQKYRSDYWVSDKRVQDFSEIYIPNIYNYSSYLRVNGDRNA
jgi:hypothetical protein